MNVEVSIDIAAAKQAVWNAIIDIENCADMISAIQSLTVLHKPQDGLVGFKWEETREMFGKQASETMWITEAVENDYYRARAESHGSIYMSQLSVSDAGENTRLTMSFAAQAQSLMAKIMSFVLGGIIKSSMRKALTQDLQDIKKFVEARG